MLLCVAAMSRQGHWMLACGEHADFITKIKSFVIKGKRVSFSRHLWQIYHKIAFPEKQIPNTLTN